MQELNIVKRNGGVYIDSREVAELIGKRHNDLLRDIRGYVKIMQKSDVRKIAHVDFFVESSYEDVKGEPRPCFLISKSGAEMVANKLTGEKGVLFTAAYVAKFNEMEAAERAAKAMFSDVHPKLGEFNMSARLIVRAYGNAGADAGRVVKFLEHVYAPLGIRVLADGLEHSALPAYRYSPYRMAKEAGIYSHRDKPHSQAVAAVMRKLDLGEEHRIITPVRYGEYIGVAMRYDESAYSDMLTWFLENDYPSEIENENRVFQVVYRGLR